LISGRKIWVAVVAVIVGSVLYRLAVAFALSTGMFGLQASDLNLVTAVLVAAALIAPKIRGHFRAKKRSAAQVTKGTTNGSGEVV